MNLWIRCPECGDNGPHTVLDDKKDPMVVACVNEEWCGVVFEVPWEDVS